MVRFSTDRDVLEEIEGDTCPLYVPSINAKTVFRNDDEYHENGNKVERIVGFAIYFVFAYFALAHCCRFARLSLN